ncbi:MAG: MBL fold metallo-hydrolase, partial [Candidatus Aminicenantaceae bacterium]
MKELAFLGTGGSVSSPKRDNCSFIINCDETLILMDCPGSVIQKIKKLNYDPEKVNRIFVTHTHPDHIYGLPSFIHSMMLHEFTVFIYGSRETIKFCKSLLDLFKLREKKVKVNIEFIPLNPGENFEINQSLRCQTFDIKHTASSLAYKYQFTDKKIELLYSGDTPSAPLLFRENPSVDYLIHDCSAPS